ncbi:hypothetical protein FOZ61_002369, partial [Perkinsus olseni]
DLVTTWWPWGAGMFATSLGPNKACFVLGAKSAPGTGHMVLRGKLSAIQKGLIESTKGFVGIRRATDGGGAGGEGRFARVVRNRKASMRYVSWFSICLSLMVSDKRRALVIGGGFSGMFAANELKGRFDVTLVDAKEYFEYTPGILRAYVKPGHYDALSFTYQSILERTMGIKFLWGEVTQLDGEKQIAHVKPMFSDHEEEVAFDYC